LADIFISYKRENLPAVQRLVQALRAAGLSLWWDQDIAPDAPWEQTIESELNAAKVVIVAWSEAAVASENVKAEARRARVAGKLIQTFVEQCEPPLFFGERQGVDLSSWSGQASDARFQAVLAAARAIIAGKRPPQGVGYAPRKRSPWATLVAVLAVVSAALGFVANLGGARDAVCSIAVLDGLCLSSGPATPPAPSAEQALAAERAALLARVPGLWGLVGRPDEPSCQRAFRLNIERRGEEDVVALTDGDYFSDMRVVTALDGVINLRALPPAERVGEPSELQPEADRLTWHYADGRSAAYVRCGD
jgi:hypothetical protein